MSWRVLFTKQARKDAKKLSASNLCPKAEQLLEIMRENPFQTPPPYEKLAGDLSGAYSRRINIQHRLVYQVIEEHRIVNRSDVELLRMTQRSWQRFRNLR